MDLLILDDIGHIHELLLLLLPFGWLLQGQTKRLCSDSLIEWKRLANHQIFVRLGTADIVDDLGHISLQMGVLVGILLCDFFWRVVELANVHSREVLALFQELRELFRKKLQVVLVAAQLLLECLQH